MLRWIGRVFTRPHTQAPLGTDDQAAAAAQEHDERFCCIADPARPMIGEAEAIADHVR